MNIDSSVIKTILGSIDNGVMFEEFALGVLAQVLGSEFIPYGGIKDQGIDGALNIYTKKNSKYESIFQISITSDPKSKLEDTIEKLNKNQITFERLTYVTNRIVNNKDKLIEEIFEKYSANTVIFDQNWFSANVNQSEATKNAYFTFIESHVHKFYKDDRSVIVDDYISDPRIYTFLASQIGNISSEDSLDDLIDSLVLFALQDTDPDKNILMSKEEITLKVESTLKFKPKFFNEKLDSRLKVLSSKPRKINFHKKLHSYCLPYESRQKIKEEQSFNIAIRSEFFDAAEKRLRKNLKLHNVSVKDLTLLIENVLHRIYYSSGLSFSNFILGKEGSDKLEDSLIDAISVAVDNSSVVNPNKEPVKRAMLATIREITYDGTINEKLFIEKLSKTYFMLFMLQCDPGVSVYFSKMASNLTLYVCTSILVPAISEIYLQDSNKRYWALLKGARASGVSLKINGTIVKELATHISKIVYVFNNDYKGNEEIYEDESNIAFIPDREILIRAFFYAKLRGMVESFEHFIDNFCNYDLTNIEQNLIDWLSAEFGIQYADDLKYSKQIEDSDLTTLTDALKNNSFKDEKTARSKAELVLTIFKIREIGNEKSAEFITGYKTWWLSLDSSTYRLTKASLGKKYHISCYIRPIFLYNFISIAPKLQKVEDTFKHVFPNLIGVDISSSIDQDVISKVKDIIKDHGKKNPARIKAKLREFSDALKSENHESKEFLEKYFKDWR